MFSWVAFSNISLISSSVSTNSNSTQNHNFQCTNSYPLQHGSPGLQDCLFVKWLICHTMVEGSLSLSEQYFQPEKEFEQDTLKLTNIPLVSFHLMLCRGALWWCQTLDPIEIHIRIYWLGLAQLCHWIFLKPDQIPGKENITKETRADLVCLQLLQLNICLLHNIDLAPHHRQHYKEQHGHCNLKDCHEPVSSLKQQVLPQKNPELCKSPHGHLTVRPDQVMEVVKAENKRVKLWATQGTLRNTRNHFWSHEKRQL